MIALEKGYSLAENCKHRLAIGVEYNGTTLHGWQCQSDPNVPTVAGLLQSAIARVADHEVKLFCAGRTDAGVHATGQVAHFDVHTDRGEKAWVMGVNSYLPDCIRVKWARAVNQQFHARHSAKYRRYEYWIENTSVASAMRGGQISWFRYPLSAEAMHRAAQALLGENDFSGFRAAACQSSTPMRNIQEISVVRHAERLCLTVQANAFLLHIP